MIILIIIIVFIVIPLHVPFFIIWKRFIEEIIDHNDPEAIIGLSVLTSMLTGIFLLLWLILFNLI